LRAILANAERDSSFGNARFARTLFEQALNAQALRLGAGDVEALSPADLMPLTPADLAAAARALGESAEPERPKRSSWLTRGRYT
jgi:stage V sporulation protein K